MARKQFSGEEEDAQALKDAFNDALSEYKTDLGVMGITEMIEAFDGDRGALARALADLPAQGKLNSFSRSEQTKYRSQFKNIDRWLRYEAGERGKQARNVERSHATQDRMKDLFARYNPPMGGVTATITGWIGYNREWRYRTISIPAIGRSVDAQAFHAAMRAGDTNAAYRVLFNGYAEGLTCAQADQFSMEFEED